MKTLAALIVVASLAVAAAPAAAERQVVAHLSAAATGEIALAGAGVAYTTTDKVSRRERQLRLATPAGDNLLRLLGTIPTSPTGDENDPQTSSLLSRIDASADRVAVWTGQESSTHGVAEDRGGTFDWGPLSNVFQPVAGACDYSTVSDYAFAVDGNRVAFESRCDGTRQVSVVDSSGTVVATADVGATGPVELHLAGRYLAWLRYDGQTRFGTIAVHDIESGQDVYTVPGANGSFDLQDDGKLVRVSTLDAGGNVVDGCATLAWFQPSEPAVAHSVPGCVAGTAKVAGDRIGFVDRAAGSVGTASIATLDGNVRAVSSSVYANSLFDFDGAHVAYAARTCVGDYALYLDDATGAATDNAGPCPVVIGAEPLKDGHLKPIVSCTDGCVGRIWLARKLRDGTYKPVTDTVPFNLKSTTSRHVLIRTKKKLVPRGKRSVRLYVQVSDTDRSGNAGTYRRAVTVRSR